ncbi:MAG: nodulation protein NfeD, partial [Nitrososphaerota archaeon]|nr:nodulation protein NfeD [Nitrososphaerota archaeon]
MKLLRAFLLLGLLLVVALEVVPVHSQSCSSQSGYYVAQLNGDIDPGAADFLSATVSSAETACAGHLIFVLSTNGGDGGSMESMVGDISNYQAWGGTFVTLVAPPGTFAFSAGSFVAEASSKIYMSTGTTIGSATPIVSGIPSGEENTTMRKDINAFTTYMEGLAKSNGRNGTASALMVSLGTSYTYSDALRLHVIDGVVNSTSLAGALSELGVPHSTPINAPGLRSTLISILSDPNVSSLLFLLGVSAVLIDIYHPTLVLSVVGVVIMAMALFGLGVFGASPLAILLMVIGAAFIFLEVKTQHGISAAIGVVVFIIGFLLVFQLPQASSPNPSLPPVNFVAIPDITYGLLVAMGAAVVIGSLYLRRIRQGLMGRPKVMDLSNAVGREGVMKSDLTPPG